MGFLGVGKTTAVLSLLKSKPADEKWAVLVNEFGEVGIDGAIIEAQAGQNNIAIKEVPGGCLCCVSGIPFQMALGMLIAREQPDRILIEPTGLGHPKKLLRTLTAQDYKDVLQIQASITLLDPRQLSDPRYRQHETFLDQCSMADVLVANKTDLCDDHDRQQFMDFAQTMEPEKVAIGWVEQGQLEQEWLTLPANTTRKNLTQHHHHHQDDDIQIAQLKEGETIAAFENSGMGHFSLGWLLAENQTFDYQKLIIWLSGLHVERAKGLLITDQGTRVVNLKNDVLTELPTRSLQQSRLELIHNEPLNHSALEMELKECLIPVE